MLAHAGAVLVSDYGRGLAAHPVLRSWMAAARSPLVWDPHPRGPEPVPGAQLVSPNESEVAGMARAAGSEQPTSPADLEQHAARLLRRWRAQAVAVTLGERGVLLSHGDGAPMMVPSPAVPCLDPCGAGDRFAASAALALGAGAVTSEAVQQAVLDAAGFVAGGGAAAVGLPAVEWSPQAHGPATHGGRPGSGRPVVVATGGCFDLLHAGHVATLEAARALGDRLVVCLNSDASVRRLKGPGRPVVPQADRARLVGALSCVDEVVVFDEDTPVRTLRRVRPDLWVKGGDYAGAELPETEVLREWGGQAVVVPYLEGRSTTGLVARAGHG